MFTKDEIEGLDNGTYGDLETAFDEHFHKQYKSIEEMVNGESADANTVEEAAQQTIDSWHEESANEAAQKAANNP
ncbi:hypothetical protein [Fibrobacter sp.]|uniref:hypothetical protein n=1 Tax=Fibrobacter sp. TaxID=35828 RepID=UPI00388E3939